MADTKEASTGAATLSTTTAGVEWDESKMSTTYANAVNAAGTRAEVALLFGTNMTWKVSGNKPVKIAVTNRIILSPYAAKRFMLLLGGVLDEYETRFGELDVELSGNNSDK